MEFGNFKRRMSISHQKTDIVQHYFIAPMVVEMEKGVLNHVEVDYTSPQVGSSQTESPDETTVAYCLFLLQIWSGCEMRARQG